MSVMGKEKTLWQVWLQKKKKLNLSHIWKEKKEFSMASFYEKISNEALNWISNISCCSSAYVFMAHSYSYTHPNNTGGVKSIFTHLNI